ncbi:MAG: OmpA family protein [Bacteroidetes bacterium]|nr:OmpA family protein [Bacteroidota bacterium]MCW5895066.1 OmpA family protein [Bacteroidota bacterium]
MPDPLLTSASRAEHRTPDALGQLRDLITAPTSAAVEDLRSTVHRLHDQLHSPVELKTLLVPIISDVLKTKTESAAHEIAIALAPIIDKTFHERTQQDKQAVVFALAPSVAKALREQHNRFPEEVAEDLSPLMGAAIREQVRAQRDSMVDALYPIIGSTIAKYMSEALKQLADNVNRKVEQAFSFRGLIRKVKSRLSGVSEAELLLQESLPFRVNAVFLIHKDSGLLIAEEHNPLVPRVDSEMVSGMLTAIRSFVNDWIARSGAVSELDTIDYGTSHILLEVAGHCYLAAVTDGPVQHTFVSQMRHALEEIVSEQDKVIARYAGHPAAVPASVQQTIRALIEQAQPKKKSPPLTSLLLMFGVILSILIATPFLLYWYKERNNREAERNIAARIVASGGIVDRQISITADGDNIALRGTVPNELLRTRVLESTKGVMPSAAIDDQLVVSASPSFRAVTASEAQRIAAALNAIEGVDILTSFEDGTLTITGTAADQSLVRRIVETLEQLPGINRIVQTLTPPAPRELPTQVYFNLGTASLPEGERTTLEGIRSIMEQYPHHHLKIIGYADGSGSRRINSVLSTSRAQAVKEALISIGIDGTRLVAVGGTGFVDAVDIRSSKNRSARFELFRPRETRRE